MTKHTYQKLSPSLAVAWLVLMALGRTGTAVRYAGAGRRHSERFQREERAFYEASDMLAAVAA